MASEQMGQQPTVLALVNGEYRIVSGHRRNLSNILNIERAFPSAGKYVISIKK